MIERVLSSRVNLAHNPWRTVRDFVRETGAAGAINFGFFHRGSNHPHNSTPVGMTLVDGEPVYGSWWDPMAVWHALVRFRDGSLGIMRSPMSWRNHEDLQHSIDWAISAGPTVLHRGLVGIEDRNDFPGLAGIRPFVPAERVGIGLNEDASEAVFLYNPSATAEEMGYLFLAEGCTDAILGDGGSSASMKTADEGVGSQLVPNVIWWEGEEGAVPNTAIWHLEQALELLRGESCAIVAPPMTRPNYEAIAGWGVTERNHYMDPAGVKYLVLHHQAGPGQTDSTAAQIHQYHRIMRGWAGIGYHAFIRLNGMIEEGRPLNRRGAHAGAAYNPVSWGACMAGNYDLTDNIPQALWDSTVHLFAWWKTLQPDALIVGHGEVAATACPGYFVQMDRFRRDVELFGRR